MAPLNDTGLDKPSLFKGETSQMVLEHYGYNTLRMVLFPKTVVRKHIDAHIRTIVVLIGGKLTGIYFLHLFYAIYYSVTTHLCLRKKVCILPPGDVNPKPIPSR
jgi:hypothetical protein